jgi:hypothetical protein
LGVPPPPPPLGIANSLSVALARLFSFLLHVLFCFHNRLGHSLFLRGSSALASVCTWTFWHVVFLTAIPFAESFVNSTFRVSSCFGASKFFLHALHSGTKRLSSRSSLGASFGFFPAHRGLKSAAGLFFVTSSAFGV